MFNTNETIKSLPALFTRVAVGYVFAYGAWSKFQNIDLVIEQFSKTGLPFVTPLTYIVCFIEIITGVMLILGFFTRYAVLPLIIIEAIAAFAVKGALNTHLSTALNFTEILYIWLFLWLLVNGAGEFSVDEFLKLRKTKQAV